MTDLARLPVDLDPALKPRYTPADLVPFEREKNGIRRTAGHSIVAWWVGNWADSEVIHTHEQLSNLARMIDDCLAVWSD